MWQGVGQGQGLGQGAGIVCECLGSIGGTVTIVSFGRELQRARGVRLGDVLALCWS